jgi:TIR domain
MAESKYDVFISYRRPEGAPFARQIEAALGGRGARPFLDLSDLCRGHFEFSLLKRVADTPNFLVVLTPGALDRCGENGDWLRKEISQAIKTSRNIIPLVMPGFQYPDELPRDLKDLRRSKELESYCPISEAALAGALAKIRAGSERQRRAAKRRMLTRAVFAGVILLAGFMGTRLLPAGASIGLGFLGARLRPRALALPSRPARLEATLAGVRSTSDGSLPPTQRITYQLVHEPDQMHVVYRLPYLDQVRQGGAVESLNCDRTVFSGEIPELAIKVDNGTDRAVDLSAGILKIESSKMVAEAVPVFDDLSPGGLRVTNQGWARIELPTLHFSITSNDDEGSSSTPETHALSLPSIADSKLIVLDEYMPAQLQKDLVVKVAGTMLYGESDDRRSVTFATRVRNEKPVRTGITTTEMHNALLHAGHTEPVIVDLQPGPKLEPGETATFLIRVMSDKTCTTRLSIGFRTTDGKLISGVPFRLEIFVPSHQSAPGTKETVKRLPIRSGIGP